MVRERVIGFLGLLAFTLISFGASAAAVRGVDYQCHNNPNLPSNYCPGQIEVTLEPMEPAPVGASCAQGYRFNKSRTECIEIADPYGHVEPYGDFPVIKRSLSRSGSR